MISQLSVDQAALVVVDMQEAFRSVIGDFGPVAERIGKAVQGATLLGVPVVVTEQYPKGLKRTAEEIAPYLNGAAVLEKMCFSSWGADGFRGRLGDRTRQVLVCGIEAHICVTQTALDLLRQGFEVHLITDCITSRDPKSKKVALKRLIQAGAIPSNLEMALFELMRSADAPQFKAVQNLIR